MHVVIVGAGQAGAALAAKLRSLGATGPITMIGGEPAAAIHGSAQTDTSPSVGAGAQ